MEVISGEEESRLAYLAVWPGWPTEGSLVVFDRGRGSSQFTFAEARRSKSASASMWAVRYTERFTRRGGGTELLGEALAAIAADLARLDGRPGRMPWWGWAGR